MRVFLQLFVMMLWGLAISLPAVAGGQGQTRTVVDGLARQITVPVAPRRVIALAPNLTEMVFSLGKGDILIGATDYSNRPEAARQLPRVGSYIRLDLERIVGLRPDLCIASQDGNPRRAIERVTAMGIPVYVVNPQNLAFIKQTVILLGDLLQAEEKAAVIARDMETRMARVRRAVEMVKERPAVFFQVDDAPMVSVGSGTFIDELIQLAGGRNIAAGAIVYPRFTWEELLRRQPAVVIITSMAGGRSEARLQASWDEWPQVEAVRNHRVHVVDADLFDRATPRLVNGLELLAALLHPELATQLETGHEQ
jgi:iron complex transport system substrate-binding protein